ncbi:MAG: gluconokinase [Acidobacteria bacterium]|nr:gluconokinase [Acidobacteriota bacterium]
MALALAIDIGTSSVRASLWNETGMRVGEVARRPVALRVTEGGAAELDPDGLVRAVAECLDERLGSAGTDACQIVAVGTSCFWHSLVGVDGEGRAVTTLTTWADSRARDVAARLRRETDERAYHLRTGAMLHSSYPVARIAWQRETGKPAFGGVERGLSFADYLNIRLFGVCATSISMASGSGLYDPNSMDWDDAALELAGIGRGNLAPVRTEPLSGLTDRFARRWPALAVVPWFAAAGDGGCATIGSGCIGPDRLALTLGTSGALRVALEGASFPIHESLFAYRIDERCWVAGGALSEGGGVLTWLSSLLGLTLGPELDAEVGAMAPDDHGLTILPFASGERSPGWRDDARFAVTGMSAGSGPVAIARAALESVAFRFQLIAESLREAVPEAAEIVGSGGALRASPAWSQILADVLGMPLLVPDSDEASSRGAALLALVATGDARSLAGIPGLSGRLFEPDIARREAYCAAARRQQALYDAIIK